jgi:ribosomal protein S12 methylthiotransferase accessory factor
MRVQLAKGWHIRPTQDGLELMAPERNIVLELSDLAFRDQLTAVLKGEKKIPNESTAQEALHHLEKAGILSFTKKVFIAKKSTGGIGNVTEKIRRELVGNKGPVVAVYWLNPKQSRFSRLQIHSLSAKYLGRTGHDEEKDEEWAGGSDSDWDWAEFKAIMEALERYASGVVPHNELIRATARQLGERAIDPRRVVAYTKTQYRNGLSFIPFSRDQEYYWKSVTILPGDKEKYLPLECLYYPVGHELTPNIYTAANSSGVAAGLSFEDALFRGLYEAIERDAFMAVWLNRMRMPRIDHNTIPKECFERVLSLEAFGYRTHFVDITLDVAPVVLAIAESETIKPSLVLGAASTPHIEQAIGKAFSEVEYQLYWTLRHPDHVRTLRDPKEVKDVLDHMALYASPEHLSKAAFLWKGEVLPMKESCSEDTDAWTVIKKLRQRGIETAVLDLTPEYFKKAGVWVVRALPLGLIPISFGYGNEPLGMKRYRQMTRRGNLWSNNRPFTHPFA